jgi:hypothetical protein
MRVTQLDLWPPYSNAFLKESRPPSPWHTSHCRPESSVHVSDFAPTGIAIVIANRLHADSLSLAQQARLLHMGARQIPKWPLSPPKIC